MRMTEDRPSITPQLVFPILLKPILLKIERRQPQVAKTLFTAICKAEQSSPGLLYDMVVTLVKKTDPQCTLNMTESILRLQAFHPEFEDQRIRRPEESFQEMNKKCAGLRKILARIPDEINQRSVFLETIKEIASAMKKLLDCVNEILSLIPSQSDKAPIELRKREFIRHSKRFSNTLKEFFKEGQTQAVYLSAVNLIHQTNSIQYTIKMKCDIQ